MTHVLVKKPQAASPWMLAVSVGLHGLVVLVALVVSATLAKKFAPTDEQITRVKLVAAPASTAAVEKMPLNQANVAPELPSEELEQPRVAVEAAQPPREAIEARVAPTPAKEIIPLKRRKSPPQRVEAAKKPEKKPDKKAKEEPPPKELSPENHLEKRLASITREVERRKKEEAAKRLRGGSSQLAATPGSQEGGTVADEELVRWLEGVRSRINSHWSVLGDQRSLRRVTVIGVKIAESGRLLDASVHNSSGDDIFDGSALRAVFQADPFPRVPSQVLERIQKAGGLALRFTPGGMQ